MKINVKEHLYLKGIYVSDQGQIWEYLDGSINSRKSNKKYCRCVIGNIHIDKYGYEIYTPTVFTCRLNNLVDRKKIKVHRLVAQCWLDNTDNLEVVNHVDYNKLNNTYSNLEWVTKAGNNAGAHRKIKHTSKDLRIKALSLLLKVGLTIKEVSSLTGITTNTLSEAKRGDVWLKERAEVQRLSREGVDA